MQGGVCVANIQNFFSCCWRFLIKNLGPSCWIVQIWSSYKKLGTELLDCSDLGISYKKLGSCCGYLLDFL